MNYVLQVKAVLTSKRNQFVLSICSGVLALGTLFTAHGPTLLDIAKQTDSSVAAATLIFTLRSIGYLVFNLMSPGIMNSFNLLHVLCVSTMASAFASLIIPFSKSLALICFCTFVHGSTMSMIDNICNCLILWVFHPVNANLFDAKPSAIASKSSPSATVVEDTTSSIIIDNSIEDPTALDSTALTPIPSAPSDSSAELPPEANDSATAWLMFMHFCFGLGAFISPALVSGFGTSATYWSLSAILGTVALLFLPFPTPRAPPTDAESKSAVEPPNASVLIATHSPIERARLRLTNLIKTAAPTRFDRLVLMASFGYFMCYIATEGLWSHLFS